MKIRWRFLTPKVVHLPHMKLSAMLKNDLHVSFHCRHLWKNPNAFPATQSPTLKRDSETNLGKIWAPLKSKSLLMREDSQRHHKWDPISSFTWQLLHRPVRTSIHWRGYIHFTWKPLLIINLLRVLKYPWHHPITRETMGHCKNLKLSPVIKLYRWSIYKINRTYLRHRTLCLDHTINNRI
jgi:hypothetical protein